MIGPLAWKTAARNLKVLLIWMPKDQMEEAVQLVLQKIGLLKQWESEYRTFKLKD